MKNSDCRPGMLLRRHETIYPDGKRRPRLIVRYIRPRCDDAWAGEIFEGEVVESSQWHVGHVSNWIASGFELASDRVPILPTPSWCGI